MGSGVWLRLLVGKRRFECSQMGYLWWERDGLEAGYG